MRRQEFDSDDDSLKASVLENSKVAHLAFLREEQLELLPYNFAYDGQAVYFHSSRETGLAKAIGKMIRFLAYDTLAWLPSTWKNPKLACPATTYFSSLSFQSVLEEVEDTKEKAGAMQLFMTKYQSEGGYVPLADPMYEKHLKPVFVGKLRVESPILKLKMGQHLTPNHRKKFHFNLRQRALQGDREVAHLMTLANSDLSSKDGWVEALTLAQLRDLTSQLAESYWAKGRDLATQAELNKNSQVLIAKCEGDRVLAFCRAAIVTPASAYLADVIVHADYRGQGLGKELMKRLVEHPRIEKIQNFMLCTTDAQSLYEKFGFEVKYYSDMAFMARENLS